MTVAEVRAKYLEFFRKRGHVIIPSAPIVPENDPTTLFTSSGMQPLVPYLLGKDHPEGKRIVNSQLSFRSGDIEEVGDNRHTTFFEMLGNWSLGDYFKKEQLPWIFEFLTSKDEGLGFDPNKLYVTVFSGDKETGMEEDTEAVSIWKELFAEKGINAQLVSIGTEEEGYRKGMGDGRIFAYDAKKNWWSRSGTPTNMPVGEPGGPDSEIFYDFGTPHNKDWGENCHVNCDCGRFVEICNSVFMQYIKKADETFGLLPKQNVDFGGGLERMVATSMGTSDVFDVDVFRTARRILEERTGISYGQEESSTRSFRVILDHTRASFFMIASHVRPSNSEAGYILRRLIRRSIREADRLGIADAVLGEITNEYAKSYEEQYPWASEQIEIIVNEINKEEEQFRKTLEQGLKEFEKLTRDDEISADDTFTLFTTYGFPIEMTQELAQERGATINMEAVALRMKEHQETSRAGGAGRFAGGLADHALQTVRYHTTHHILLAALQKVLGTDVKQRGSNITSERLRIDFSHTGKMTEEQKKEVEDVVNDIIRQDLPVIRTVMPKGEAERIGAQMEFGVKYADTVSVYSVGPKHATDEIPSIVDSFSLEFCGGPHVENTKEIYHGTSGTFKILKEEAVASGVRRIKAVVN